MTVAELAASLQAAQLAQRVAAHRKNWTPSATPATDLGYACELMGAMQGTQVPR